MILYSYSDTPDFVGSCLQSSAHLAHAWSGIAKNIN